MAMKLFLAVAATAILVLLTVYLVLLIQEKQDKKLAKENEVAKKRDGDIYVDDSGDMYAQFDIPVDAIQKKRYVVMRVHHVKAKSKKENE